MIHKNIILLIALIINLSASAQQEQIKAISIGRSVPDVLINNVRNYPQTSFKISEFKDKLIIFDFWDVNCIPCIQAFPKLDSLQNEFGDKIQIILVTRTPKSELDKWYAIRKKGSALHRYTPKAISVIQDTVLSRLFPHSTIPHSVWINGEGILQAVTQGHYVSSDNIGKMLTDRSLKLPEKIDFLAYDTRRSQFPQIYLQYPEKLKYYSTLMQKVPGSLSGSQKRFGIDSINRTVSIERVGTILTFYGDIFSSYKAGDPYKSAFYDFGKRVALDIKDSSRFFFEGNLETEEYDAWRSNNQYQYETVLPLMTEKEAYRHYLEDMNTFFGVEAKYEDREMKCLRLVRTSSEEKFKSIVTTLERSGGTTKDGTYFMKNGSLLGFVGILSEKNKNKPYLFMDSTGYKGRVDIEIKSSLSNLNAVKKELNKKYDLDLVEANQIVPVLVISDKKKAN